MSYEISTDPQLALSVHRQAYRDVAYTNQKGLTLIRDGEPVAAVLYDNYSGANIFMHVAAVPTKRWMNRHFLHEAFKFPFITMGCKRVTGWVEADNIVAQKFDEHLGFRREAVLKSAGEHGQDVFLYVMFREDCRYA